jgi:hypothetical protein
VKFILKPLGQYSPLAGTRLRRNKKRVELEPVSTAPAEV